MRKLTVALLFGALSLAPVFAAKGTVDKKAQTTTQTKKHHKQHNKKQKMTQSATSQPTKK